MQEIRAQRCNSGVQRSHSDPLPLATMTALALASQESLLAFQAALHNPQVFGIAGLVAITGDDHVLDTEVQPNSLTRDGQCLNEA